MDVRNRLRIVFEILIDGFLHPHRHRVVHLFLFFGEIAVRDLLDLFRKIGENLALFAAQDEGLDELCEQSLFLRVLIFFDRIDEELAKNRIARKKFSSI